MRSSLLALVSLPLLAATPQAVRLDLGTVSDPCQDGWTKWVSPHRDGFGPIERQVGPTSFAPEGFRLRLGPKKALGCRSAKPGGDPRSALVNDSFFAPAESPPTLDLTGLPEGEFRVVLWFNDARGYEWPPVTVLASDAKGDKRPAATDVLQGGSPDSSKVGRADFSVFSDGKKPIHIATQIPTAAGRKQYVFLCAIEVLDGASVQHACLPVPPDGTAGLRPGPVALRWSPARNATNQQLLVGPAPDSLVPVAKNPTGNEWQLQRLAFSDVRFWRVDATIDGRSVPGPVWQFSMATGRATHPVPRTDSPAIPTSTTLHWRLPQGADSASIWFGPDPDHLVLAARNLAKQSWAPPLLERDCAYSWRVDPHHGPTNVKGRVWQFRTNAGGARNPSPADSELDVAADRWLRWTPGGNDAKPTLLLGETAQELHPVQGTVANGNHRVHLRFGQTLYWRIDETYGTKTIPGPVWRFTVGARLVIDDFEGYTEAHRLADTWQDARATVGTGPIATLGGNGLNTLLIDPAGTNTEVSRILSPPQDWQATGADRIAAFVSVPVQFVVQDAAGKQASVSLQPENGTASLPLAALQGIDLGHVARIAFQAASPVEIDDLRLLGNAAIPSPAIGEFGAIRGAPPAPDATTDTPLRELQADVCVVGGGSGGIGAAVAAARAGARVLLVERNQILGGTSTSAYVINWEPGPGCSLASEIVDRLTPYPEGRIITRATDYEGTLTRASNGRVEYELEPFHEVTMAMLRETGCARVLLNTTFVRSATDRDQKRVRWIEAVRDGQRYRIRARVFIDCTGSGFLCQTAGCEAMLGADPKSRFDEPNAPDEPAERLNAIELCYRIRKSPNPARQALPEGRKLRRGGAAWPLPSGDFFVNTCGGLGPGWLLMDLGYEGARKELELRVQQHWHWLQQEKYPDYEFDSYAPMLAIRESHRILGEYVLRQQDLAIRASESPHPDIIAIADHPMDTHGAGGGLGDVAAPYGIPYRCLVPKGPWRNLLVACRGSSFSHIAASSCRLSRTMMALGHAAGLAAAEAARESKDVMAVDIPAIQAELRMPPE